MIPDSVRPTLSITILDPRRRLGLLPFPFIVHICFCKGALALLGLPTILWMKSCVWEDVTRGVSLGLLSSLGWPRGLLGSYLCSVKSFKWKMEAFKWKLPKASKMEASERLRSRIKSNICLRHLSYIIHFRLIWSWDVNGSLTEQLVFWISPNTHPQWNDFYLAEFLRIKRINANII